MASTDCFDEKVPSWTEAMAYKQAEALELRSLLVLHAMEKKEHKWNVAQCQFQQ